jgi:aspartyl-tRNA(Asn)/glutamyl-tRNA(Gln) amidotransferase subunit C
MSVSREEIRRIAALAELHVDDETASVLEGQLSRILDYVAQLQELPVEGEAGGDERAVRLRRDEVAPDRLEAPPSAFAPAMKQSLFLVPRLGELDRGEAEAP